MAFLRTFAVVLKSRRWGEADRIVTFYTLQFGKLRGVARGVRKPKSRFGSSLEPFVHCDLHVFEKGNDPLVRITHADIRESNVVLREDLALMAGAGRLVNLLDAVTAEGDAGPKAYNALVTGLRALRESTDPLLTTIVFQIRLLGHTGFRPLTDHCATCGLADKQEAGYFSAIAGGMVCADCAARRPDHCLALSRGGFAFLQQALALPEGILMRLKANGQIRQELDRVIESYVRVVAGRCLPPADFLVAERSPDYS